MVSMLDMSAVAERGAVQQEVQHHGYQHGAGDFVLLHHVEKSVGAETLHDVESAAFLQHRDKERGCRMGQGRGNQHAQVFREFPFRHLDLGHVGGDAVGAHHALGFARGTAGEVDGGNILGRTSGATSGWGSKVAARAR